MGIGPKQKSSHKGAKTPGGARANGQKGRQARPEGIDARFLAIVICESVTRDLMTLDEALERAFNSPRFSQLEARDRAFARSISTAALRHHAQLDRIVSQYLNKPLAASAVRAAAILRTGAAQLLMLDAPPHAVISTAVELTRHSPKTRHLDRMTNAVLRKVAAGASESRDILDDVASNIPDWLMQRWHATYGGAIAGQIAVGSLRQAPLDITTKPDFAADAADALEATHLATGSLRRTKGGRVETLAGFDEGSWWVQDAAAALPARLVRAKPGQSVLDACAAPGGKTAQLAASGARVRALDLSGERLARLKDNMNRLKLDAQCEVGDCATWQSSDLFDAVLIDAPCSATGTIRRHPDILHNRTVDDIWRLSLTQGEILRNMARAVRVGGTLVFCTCSLEPEEGPNQIEAFLSDNNLHAPAFVRDPVSPAEVGGHANWITNDGDVRTLPHYAPKTKAGDDDCGGIDGFYVARLRRHC